MTRPNVQTILTDLTVTATLDQAARSYADDYLAGWPTTTPGASPAEQGPVLECPRRDCNQSRPCPTHDGGLTRDKVITELDQYLADLRTLAYHAERAARFTTFYGLPGLNEASVKKRLFTIDAAIWCENCSLYGRHEPRKADKTLCDFCDGFGERRFRRANGGIWQAPPKEIWDARDARNGRIDETTILRILRNLEADRRAKAAEIKARQRADKKVS